MSQRFQHHLKGVRALIRNKGLAPKEAIPEWMGTMHYAYESKRVQPNERRRDHLRRRLNQYYGLAR